MRACARRIPILVTVAVGLALAAAPSVRAEANLPARFPAAGELVRAVAVRAEPSPSAPIVRRLRRFRPDHQFQIVLALSSRRGADGAWWYRLSLPGQPNGAPRLGPGGRGRGPAGREPDRRPAGERAGSRCVASATARLLLRSAAAIGAAGSETPRGRSFYVQSAFVPTDPFFGTFALETSAFARVTDWPSNVVGIHGTNLPALLGQAVSHGCVRVSNGVATRLRRLAPLGTPIDIVRC